MRDVARRLAADPANHAVMWGGALVYLMVFQIALGDLTLDAGVRPAMARVMSNWESLIFRARVPFQYEAVAILQAPFVVWLVSPLNLATGAVLGLLTGSQIAVVRVARGCAVACGLSPVTGLLAGLPGLLAGGACCAPILFLFLGIQLTASLVTAMTLLIPVAFVMLLAGLAVSIAIAARRCA